ncbi:MAG: DUF2306 domain-containing protein [Alphaproteobacteria bacterium]|nr:DUF2306 domain-containing protein [Alphaproteobacteria bacterium]MCB9696005.1 DUF2306 domain-containing protein [Alphaproteobacteria bacterium]
MFEVARGLHIAAGAVALLAFLVPAVARKGGRLHRRVGWVYAGSMAVVAVTGATLCVLHLLRGDPVGPSLFLLYVAWLSVTSLWTGLRALRTKARRAPGGGPLDLAVPAVLALAGVAIAGWGLWTGAVVHVAFGALGAVLGASHLRYWRTAPSDGRHWYDAHSGNLIGAGIATFTAFAVVNAAHLGLPATFAWLLPTVVGVPVIAVVQRRPQRA